MNKRLSLISHKGVSQEFPDDVARIVRACDEAGYNIDEGVAMRAWRDHSEILGMFWLGLSLDHSPLDDSYILEMILQQTTIAQPKRSLLITIPDEQSMSWNGPYAGMHWRQRQREAQRVHWLVAAHIPLDTAPFDNIVNIRVTCYFKDLRVIQDSDNIMDKLYIDGVKVSEIIKDDDRRFVHWTATRSLLDRVNPRVEILIEEM